MRHILTIIQHGPSTSGLATGQSHSSFFKKGDKTNPANYKPVSLTCIACKSFEHIVFSQDMNHLDNHKILVEFQNGFRSGHSCEAHLLNTVVDLSRRTDRRQTTNLLILDFNKVFDTVPHRRLLHKLQHYWVTGKTNEWIKSWLCQCQQRVVLDRSTSSDSEVLSCVPQGTNLGPLMFLLYFNDIGNTVSPQTSIKLFAGDCLLYRTINSASDEEQLQQDLNTMVEWSNTWLMRFNAAKCHLLTRQRKPLPTKYSINNINSKR